MTAIVFILIFLGIVLVHEWGHFYIARKCGMRVLEFGFGLPPRIKGIKKGATLYSINALPIGGFVRIAGENGPDDTIPAHEQFDTKPWYAKSAVLIAGVLCNAILGFVLFFAAYLNGVPIISPEGTPTIISLSDNMPAQASGLLVGDSIVSISAKDQKIITPTTEALHTFLVDHPEPVTLTITRDKETKIVTVTPNIVNEVATLGIQIEQIKTSDNNILHALSYAWQQLVATISLIFVTLASLISGLFSHHPNAEGLVGPVGLVKIVGDATKIGLAYVLALAAAISVNLAVINILPFPALDGGRLLIVLLEAITGKTFSKKTVSVIHTIGFLILIGLMILLTIKDIKG